MNMKLKAFFEEKRRDFPLLKKKKFIYFDNAATTQKPKILTKSIKEFYEKFNSNVGRGVYDLAGKATSEFELAREKVANFLNCNSGEVAFTSSATDSLNKIAFGLEDYFKAGDEILIPISEHHSNFVCWQKLAEKKKLKLQFVEITKKGKIDVLDLKKKITQKTKLISFAYVSNVLGVENPAKEIVSIARKNKILTVVDGSQIVSHKKIDLADLGCDFFAFSAHKMYGPFGVGVLAGKFESLKLLKPTTYGGGMVEDVDFEFCEFRDFPYAIEAGTQNIAGVFVFGKVLDYLNEIGFEKIELYEKELVSYFFRRISKLKFVELLIKGSNADVLLFSFNVSGVHAHDVASIFNHYGICVRAGNHCAVPLGKKIGVNSSVRVSLSFYNSKDEIDYFIDVLRRVKDDFEQGKHLL